MNSLFVNSIIICVHFCPSIHCYNIDTEFPIIFRTNINENVENYFGISVEMQNVEDKINFIIGAPKTNSSLYNVRQSGTVFRCELNSSEEPVCHEIDFNFHRTSRRGPQNRHMSDDMYLGGTIVSRPNSAQVAVCGHKWSQELYINREYQINPSGSCFVMDLGKPRESAIGVFPLTDLNLQFKDNTYYYSHSLSGFSAAYTQSGENLLLGSPGFYQWRGSFMETERIAFGVNNQLKERFLIRDPRKIPFATESYAGYSITSGHFLAGYENSITIGAPRDLNYRGRVYIYNLMNSYHSEESTQVFSHIDGTQIGEYFGASMLSVNINNDEFSDLIIGAPFYSSTDSGDCGRVYVYFSNGNGFNRPQILSGSESFGSRFGTSIADLGDINYDGYNDIAIGAPYEDGSGAVYIYLGSRTELETPFAQRISAKEHLNQINLKGFGISIAGNRDVDKNFYNDIFIGSYLTNKAVLLRTKPIVNIKSEILLNKTQININDQNCEYIDTNTTIRSLVPCVQLKYCIKYEGSFVPSSLNLNVSLQLDSGKPENPRCFIHAKNEKRTQLTKVVTISAISSQYCFDDYIVYLKNKSLIDDIFTPIEFSLNYSLIHLQSKQTFCPKCPIIANNQKITNQLHFQTGCRVDKKCISILNIFSKTLLNNNEIKINEVFEGFHKSLTLITTVQNRGEPSYLTKLLIYTKPKLNLLKQDISCRLPKNSLFNETKQSIECEVGNPLNTQTQQQIVIPFDVSQLDINVNQILFNIELKTASEVTKDSTMNDTIALNVVRNASLQIIGNSLKSEELYETKSKRKENLIQFSGVFQIIKQNWSSVESVFIEMTFPSLFNKQPLIFKPYIELSRGVSVNCNQTISTLPVLSNDKSSVNRFKRSSAEEEDEKSDKKVLKLDCNSHISCQKLECFAGPFNSDKQKAQFLINSALNIKNIESIFGEKYDKIKLIVKTKATILDQRITSNTETIETNFLFKRIDLSSESIDKWIILVSAGIGILILVVIVFILIKFGFFVRKRIENKELNEEIIETNNTIDRNSLLDFDDNGFDNGMQDIDCDNELSVNKS